MFDNIGSLFDNICAMASLRVLKNLHFADSTKVDKKDTKAKLSPLFDVF